MTMIWQEVDKKASVLEAFYKKKFEEVFGMKPPNCEQEDINTLRWLLSQYPDLKTCERLLSSYLRLEDDWIRGQGFPIKFLKKFVQAAIVSQADISKEKKELWVLTFTESGRPIVDLNPARLKEHTRYKPVLFEEWKKMNIEDKLQFSKEVWVKKGNFVDEWITNWVEWGFLPPGSNIKHNPMGHLI